MLVHSVKGPFWRNITKKRSQWHQPWRGIQWLAPFTLGFFWQACAPVFWRQSTVTFGRISVITWWLCPSWSNLEIWTLGYSFCAILSSTVDTSSSIVLGGFWTNFQYCLREGELGSCGRFTSCSSWFLRVVQFGEVCTVVASIPWTA